MMGTQRWRSERFLLGCLLVGVVWVGVGFPAQAVTDDETDVSQHQSPDPTTNVPTSQEEAQKNREDRKDRRESIRYDIDVTTDMYKEAIKQAIEEAERGDVRDRIRERVAPEVPAGERPIVDPGAILEGKRPNADWVPGENLPSRDDEMPYHPLDPSAAAYRTNLPPPPGLPPSEPPYEVRESVALMNIVQHQQDFQSGVVQEKIREIHQTVEDIRQVCRVQQQAGTQQTPACGDLGAVVGNNLPALPRP